MIVLNVPLSPERLILTIFMFCYTDRYEIRFAISSRHSILVPIITLTT